MAYSAATYKGDGSQSTYMIPFDYLQKDFVKVTIDEVDKVYAQDYNVDGRELSFPTAPPSGSIIKIYRETPTDRMVKWNEGSVLTSSNMTTQQIQELHLIEEATYNLKDSAMVKTENNHKWEGQYLPITHVGNPTDDSDVVNLGTIKKEETGFLASVRSQLDKWLADLGTTYNNYKDTLLNKYNEYLSSLTATKDAVKDSEANASKYKDEAKSASDSAKKSANQCAGSVATCTTRVTEANQAKESARASANTATTKATESGNSATLAKKWAVSTESPDGAVGSKSSKTWAEEAKASEQKATTSANNAKSSENKAKTSEVNAKASETASANSANASAKSATAAKGSEDKAKTSEVNAKASEVAAAESAKQAAHGQINADWNVTDTTSKAFIKNKPDVLLKSGGTATGTIIAPSFQSPPDDSHYVTFSKLRGQGGIDTYYHAIDFGYTGHDMLDFYEIKGIYNFYRCPTGRVGDATRIGSIQEGQGWNGLVKGQDITTYAKKSDLSTSLSTTSLTVTGTTSVPTANAGNSSKAIANTAYVQGELTNYLPLSGGTMTGNTLITMGNGESYVRNWANGLYLGGTYDNNASRLVLFTNSSGNGFQLDAGNGTTLKRLDGHPDGTLTWGGQPLLPVGIVQAFAGTTIPNGWLLCDGSAVSRTTYADLYAVIGTTYGAGDGSTTFNLPNLVDKFVEGSATAGTVKSAGLPNITGKLSKNGDLAGYFEVFEGAFSADGQSLRHPLSNGTGNYNLADGGVFNASRSNPIYGNSTTVQPPALTMRYIIKY